MSRVPAVILFVTAIFFGSVATAFSGERSDGEQRIKRAVYAEGKLWLLTEKGQLSTIREGENRRFDERSPLPSLDICVQNGHPVEAACETAECDTWSIRRHLDAGWSLVDYVKSEGEKFVALECESESVGILTSRSFIQSIESRQTSISLTDQFSPYVSSMQLLVIASELFVGLDRGEWGGGLRQISLHSGPVVTVGRRASDEICSGPLNTNCDPVTGIAVEPWKPQCAVIAIGLMHLMAHGRLDEVCGDTVRSLYSRLPEGEWATAERRKIIDSIPFYGLVNAQNALWTVGLDGIYRIEETGVTRIASLPKYESVDGVKVNFDFPDLVLLLETISSPRPEDGAVPMIVAR
jgi:hypothetical protein